MTQQLSYSTIHATLWIVVIVEILSPVPLFLSLGAIYVLLFRPPWFREFVRALYSTGQA